MVVGYYKNYLYTTDISSAKKKNKESQYMVSHPETGSDSPIGSDRDRGRDIGGELGGGHIFYLLGFLSKLSFSRVCKFS